jgi:carbamoyltransferase
MLILGLNAYHADSAACVVRDGELIAAAEEERFRRIKHWAGLPTEAIRYCLAQASAGIGDIDHVAINRRPSVNNWRRLLFLLRHRPDFSLMTNRLRNAKAAVGVQRALRTHFDEHSCHASFHQVEHHLAHLASASVLCESSPAVCVSVDGFGDFASTAWGIAREGSVDIHGRIYFPHSLGIFYTAITQFLGFRHFGDEYKVMGLAAYGQAHYTARMRELVHVRSDGTFRLNLKYFRHHLNNVAYTWNNCAPEVDALYTADLERLLGSARNPCAPLDRRHKDLACSAQAIYEDTFFALLNSVYERYECPNLALAGGCALNSVANGKICSRSPFKRVFIPPAAGDSGGAVGAAFVVWQKVRRQETGIRNRKGEQRTKHPNPPSGSATTLTTSPSLRSYAYAGPEFDDALIGRLLDSRSVWSALGLPALSTAQYDECETSRFKVASSPRPPPSFPISVTRFRDTSTLCHHTAQALSEGKVVGWFQGRMEWGPRALGNRSILCDPRRADMKDVLNAKIKRRESFRPFAPSILREHVRTWFNQDSDVPFMTEVFQLRHEHRIRVPAITHVDGSGRLQTVDRALNPLFWRLISEFNSLTAVPMLLNTSFNENEPIVCRPEEALDCFLRTEMDILVLGTFFICRTEKLNGAPVGEIVSAEARGF